MSKSTINYWNALNPENASHWKAVEGLEHSAEELMLSIDPATGE